jgi:hypothetical protein
MKVAAVVSDLMLYSRIESAARVAGIELARVDDPHHIPSDAELVLVDWSERGPDWAEALQPTVGRRVIVFGPHTDLPCRRTWADVGAIQAAGGPPGAPGSTRRPDVAHWIRDGGAAMHRFPPRISPVRVKFVRNGVDLRSTSVLR